MIASVKGIVELLDSPHIIVDVNGVGYRVLVSTTILSSIVMGQQIKLFTYTHVREDLLELYGFLQQQDLKLFEKLLGVSGIGPKTAIGIFTLGEAHEITQAIIAGDVDFFTGVPRLGRKNAQKIIIELKSKLSDHLDFDLSDLESKDKNDIVTALTHFGFSEKEAQSALRNIGGQGKTTEEKIKLALKYLGK